LCLECSWVSYNLLSRLVRAPRRSPPASGLTRLYHEVPSVKCHLLAFWGDLLPPPPCSMRSACIPTMAGHSRSRVGGGGGSKGKTEGDALSEGLRSPGHAAGEAALLGGGP